MKVSFTYWFFNKYVVNLVLLVGSRNPNYVFNEALCCACVAVLYRSTAVYSYQGVISGDHVTSHND